MEGNMTYKIQETSKTNSEVDLTSIIAEVEATTPVCSDISTDSMLALELNYSTNFNIKQLGQIMDYYNLSKRKLKKDELIQKIILYESNIDNIYIVENRKRLWENIEELKNDPYFSKFVLFTP